MTKKPTTWIITEGLTGTENQCLGIAEALGVTPLVKRVKLNEPWKTLSPYIGFESENTFNSQGDEVKPPWPDLLISSGRKSIAAARFIKKHSKQKTFVVQIQDTRLRRDDFDLLVVPEHDPASRLKNRENIFVTAASPNRITFEKLHEAKSRFSQFADLPSPRIGVLVGGTAGAQILTPDMMQKLTLTLKGLAAEGYGLMITTSRRTGAQNTEILKSGLSETGAYIWNGPGEQAGENPYFGILGWADALIVTSESMSMVSEAGSTGKPVYTVDLGGAKPRHLKMLENLKKRGVIRNFEGEIAEWAYEPLHDARDVADEIRRKSGLF